MAEGDAPKEGEGGSSIVGVLETSIPGVDQVPPTHLGAAVASGSFEMPATIDSRYKVRRKLGEGATGVVFEVEHEKLGRTLALKVLHQEIARQAQFGARFEREARTAAQLDHPHIVRVTDFGSTPDGHAYMVMEFVEGDRLSQKMGVDRMDPLRAIEIVDQLLAGLGHAHAQGVIHRDVKPDNVIVTKEGVKLLDFGLAKLRDAPAGDQPLTREGMVFGTPRYMSPEQVTAEPVDARGDLYAVGVILYELLAGRPLFTGESVVEIMSKQVSVAPQPLELAPSSGVDVKHLEEVVLRALQKSPKDRFPDALSFRQGLHECLIGVTTPLQTAYPGAGAATLASGIRSGAAEPLARANSGFRSVTQTGIWKRRIVSWRTFVALGLVLAGLYGARYLFESPLQRGERLLREGSLAEAKPVVDRLFAEDPKNPRVLLLAGHVSALEENAGGAVDRYSKALEADPKVARDPLLMRHLRALTKASPAHAETLAIKIAQTAPPEADGVLLELAKNGHRSAVRREAYKGLERIGEDDKLDRYEYLTSELAKNGSDTCSTRQWYVTKIVELKDKRAIPILERELERRGGLFKTQRTAACMEIWLRAQIEALKE